MSSRSPPSTLSCVLPYGGGDGERSVSLENPLWPGTTRVAIFMPAGVASGDIAQNYLLEPLSQAAATQLYRKDTSFRSAGRVFTLRLNQFRTKTRILLCVVGRHPTQNIGRFKATNRQDGAWAGTVRQETSRVSATEFCNKANASNGAAVGPFFPSFLRLTFATRRAQCLQALRQ